MIVFCDVPLNTLKPNFTLISDNFSLIGRILPTSELLRPNNDRRAHMALRRPKTVASQGASPYSEGKAGGI